MQRASIKQLPFAIARLAIWSSALLWCYASIKASEADYYIAPMILLAALTIDIYSTYKGDGNAPLRAYFWFLSLVLGYVLGTGADLWGVWAMLHIAVGFDVYEHLVRFSKNRSRHKNPGINKLPLPPISESEHLIGFTAYGNNLLVHTAASTAYWSQWYRLPPSTRDEMWRKYHQEKDLVLSNVSGK